MRKAFGPLVVAGLVVVGMATALAATPGDGVRDYSGPGLQQGNGYAWGFVDADGDGINDNFVDANNDGVCDNFVDADGDGINDLRGTRGMGGHGPRGAGACSGDAFVDADGDGVCDNAGGAGGMQRRGRTS